MFGLQLAVMGEGVFILFVGVLYSRFEHIISVGFRVAVQNTMGIWSNLERCK